MATTGSTLSSLQECSDESSGRDEGDGSYLDLIVDWSNHSATGGVLECAEAGRDVDLNLSKRVEADSGLEHFSGDPCAVFGRNVGLNFCTRVEVTGNWS